MRTKYILIISDIKKKLSDSQFIILLSIIVAVVAALAAILMKNSVHFIDNYLKQIETGERWLYLFFPTMGFILVYLIANKLLKIETGHGIPGILFAISRKNGRIKRNKTYSSLLTSILTVGFGGSVGLEGPSASTGAAIGSNIGKYFQTTYKQQIAMIGCGSTAAIAAIFNTPIAAIVFSLEVLMLDLSIASIIPLLISSVTAVILSYFLLGQQTIWLADFSTGFVAHDTYWYILLGVFSSVVSILFTRVYVFTEQRFKKISKPIVRIFVGGSLLGMLIYIFPSLYGEGYEVVNYCLKGDFNFIYDSPFLSKVSNMWIVFVVLLLIIVLKIFATNITFGSGGVGGIFAPSLFIGAVTGMAFAVMLNAMGFKTPEPGLFVLAAMAGVMAGILHGPLTAIFLIAEVTKGYELFVPLMLTSVVGFIITRIFTPNSVYTIQLAKRNELLTHDKNKSVLSMIKIERLLETDFYVLKDYYTLGDIVKGIEKSPRNVFPVVDESQELIGILTLNDIRHIMFKNELWEQISVKQLMYQPKITFDIGQSIELIAQQIHNSGHFNIPVLNNKKYMGFISRANIFSVYQKLSKKIS
jgi:chloride channel protein, CIC family